MRQRSLLSRLLTWGLSVFFYLLYNPMAWTYDWVAAIVSVGRWKTWVLSVMPDLPGSYILEIGHGPGHLQISLSQKQRAAFGIDRSRQMGRIAQRRLHALGLDCSLVNGMAQYLPYRSRSFNQVVATFPAPFIIEKRTLEEIYRVLIPGGTLIIIPVAWITGSSPIDRMAASIFRLLGQAPDWDDINLQPFREAGFIATVERREIPGSEILLIKALRQDVGFSSAI